MQLTTYLPPAHTLDWLNVVTDPDIFNSAGKISEEWGGFGGIIAGLLYAVTTVC